MGGPLTLGAALSGLREADEQGLAELAKLLGVSRSHLCDIEQGRRSVSTERAARFAQAFGGRSSIPRSIDDLPYWRKISWDGSNRVNVIRSTAERQAAVEFAKAAATRPQIVGKALGQIAETPFIANALFEVLETQALLAGNTLEVNVVPPGVPLVYAMGGGPMMPVK
jgi:transcriptional regulator with XRE-family HTH domain